MALGRCPLSMFCSGESVEPTNPESINPEYMVAILVAIRNKCTFLSGVRGFVAADIRGLRDQICSTEGPKVNCVRQVDF